MSFADLKYLVPGGPKLPTERGAALEDEQRNAKLSQFQELFNQDRITPIQLSQAVDDVYKDAAPEQRAGVFTRMFNQKKAKAQDAKNAEGRQGRAQEEQGILAGAKPPAQPAPKAPPKPPAEKATWLKGEDGQDHPFELKDGKYVPVEAPQGATSAPPPARPPVPESDYQKALVEYRNKVLELQQAKQKAAENPNNPQAKAALLRAQGEAMRSLAYMIRAKAGASGTDLKGNPLPGAVTDAEGNPVGSMFAGNIKPTGVEIQRADLAGSTLEQIDSVKSLISKRPDLFGPAAGRAVNFTQWLGSQDPDAQKFKAATDTIASHLSGVYGARGAYSQGAIAKTIGENRTNPEALTAALNQYAIAAKNIQAKGTRHTVGGSPQNANAGPAPKAGQGGAQKYKVGDPFTQNGHKFKATAVDQNGKVTAADPVQ